MRTFEKNENGVIIITEYFDGHENRRVVTSEQIKMQINDTYEVLKSMQASATQLEADLIEVEKLES
jgi:hypothetical protein